MLAIPPPEDPSLPAPLLLLPPELLARICLPLASSCLASLELSCSSLRCSLQRAGVWRTRLRRVESTKSYSFVCRALEYCEGRGWQDQRVAKVLLGLREVIKDASYGLLQSHYLHQSSLYKHCRMTGVFKEAVHRQMSRRMQQIKAWSREVLEHQAEYDKLEDHKDFCERTFGGDGDIDVCGVLEDMWEEAGRRFEFQWEEEASGLERQCAAINPRFMFV